MNFFLAMLAWLAISFLFGLGIWLMAVKGIFWVLALVTIGFTVAVWKIGCQAH